MGSSSSRMTSRPKRDNNRRTTKRTLSSLFACGAASSSRTAIEMEDDPAEFLVNSAERSHLAVGKFQCPRKEPALANATATKGKSTSDTRPGCTAQNMDDGGPSKSCGGVGEVCASEGRCSGNIETNDEVRCLSKSMELVPHQFGTEHGVSYSASTSNGIQSASDLVFANESNNMNTVTEMRNTMNRDSHARVSSVNCSSACGPRDSSDGNNAREVPPNSGSISASVTPDSPLSFSLRENTSQEASSSGLGFLVSEREQGWRDASVLHVDVVSISSDMLSSSAAEASSGEARRNSRRLFWDAFSRRSSRRHSESQFSADDSDDLGSRDRWLFDFSDDFFNDGVGGDFMNFRRNHNTRERQWHSRSEIRERANGGMVGTRHPTGFCSSGLHLEGSCSCASVLTAEESGQRASISRIVMLAEALFEVLDEIHRQPVSLSLSMVSLPAPESVVDSFQVRCHKKSVTLEEEEDVAQCYICLAEYEDGDKIRVLPCNHEFHITCVDKWLKEIHGVCPLCRGDVREGLSEESTSNSEIPSL